MNIIVTGGAGFVGSNLIENLVCGEHQIYSIDNYFLGTKENHVGDGCIYLEGSTKNILDLLPDQPIDLVYHLGEYSKVETSFQDREKVWEYNLEGTRAVLEFCLEKEAKIIYAGSSSKFSEKGDSLSPYTWSKSKNGELIKNYGDWFGLEYAICYFYNVFGDRQLGTGKYAGVVRKFYEMWKSDKPMPVVRPGTQERIFTHVDDIVEGLLLLQDNSGDGYCFGGSEKYTIIQLAKMFSDDIKMIPARDGNRLDAKIDREKAEEIGWQPQKKLENYVKEIKQNTNRD